MIPGSCAWHVSDLHVCCTLPWCCLIFFNQNRGSIAWLHRCRSSFYLTNQHMWKTGLHYWCSLQERYVVMLEVVDRSSAKAPLNKHFWYEPKAALSIHQERTNKTLSSKEAEGSTSPSRMSHMSVRGVHVVFLTSASRRKVCLLNTAFHKSILPTVPRVHLRQQTWK